MVDSRGLLQSKRIILKNKSCLYLGYRLLDSSQKIA